jgi:hypothetical protein
LFILNFIFIFILFLQGAGSAPSSSILLGATTFPPQGVVRGLRVLAPAVRPILGALHAVALKVHSNGLHYYVPIFSNSFFKVFGNLLISFNPLCQHYYFVPMHFHRNLDSCIFSVCFKPDCCKSFLGITT